MINTLKNRVAKFAAPKLGFKAVMLAVLLGSLLLTSLEPQTAAAYGGRTPSSVVAFYYPWYEIAGNQNTWAQEGNKMTSRPSTLYHSGDVGTMRRHMEEAKSAGVDSFAVSWDANRTPVWTQRIKQMLDNAPTGFTITTHFETSLMPENQKSVGGVVNALKQIYRDWVNHPNFFRYQGRPVIYFWWPQGIPGNVKANWQNIRNQVDPNHTSIWSVDTVDFGLLDVFDSVHYFSGAKWTGDPTYAFNDLKGQVENWNNTHGGARRVVSNSVTPGYDDRRFRNPGEFRDREGGNYYRRAWDAALGVGPDLITISTWNEWFEGSAIEKGRDWGDSYLNITREKTGVLRGYSAPLGDASIFKTWRRTDLPVVTRQTDRSWMWGPEMFAQKRESYQESPGGSRMTYYFDKSRMEINRPGGPPDVNDLFYITNGLLPVELITGQLKTGDNRIEQRGSANIPVAGDNGNNANTPTYAALKGVLTINGSKRSGNRVGQPVVQTMAGNGATGANNGYSGKGVKLATYIPETGHNIASPFWEFMQRSGTVYEDNQYRNGLVVEWVFAMGYPLTEPYWIRSRVGGSEKDVLIQVFERRILTYTPDNSAAYRVEMGNVGRHYYNWRYGG